MKKKRQDRHSETKKERERQEIMRDAYRRYVGNLRRKRQEREREKKKKKKRKRERSRRE